MEVRPGLYFTTATRYSTSFTVYRTNGNYGDLSGTTSQPLRYIDTATNIEYSSNSGLTSYYPKLTLNFAANTDGSVEIIARNDITTTTGYEVDDGYGFAAINKRDASSGLTIAGAAFKITEKETGTVVAARWVADATATVDASVSPYTISGRKMFISPVLPNGTYIFEEIEAPSGYTLSPILDDRKTEVTISGIQTVAVLIDNYSDALMKPWERTLQINKLESFLRTGLTGSKFSVTNTGTGATFAVDLTSAVSGILVLPYRSEERRRV